jgi:hypothetical protein
MEAYNQVRLAKTGRPNRPLRFMTFGDGCQVCVSHSLNAEGYFKHTIGGVYYLFHRVVWELGHGPIPDGFEIDHTCHNRACCNVGHLRVIKKSSHATHHNKMRYSYLNQAREYWEKYKPTSTELGLRFGVKRDTASSWIKKWRAA